MNKRMKKFLGFALVAGMAFSLVACAGKETEGKKEESTKQEGTKEEDSKDKVAVDSMELSKVMETVLKDVENLPKVAEMPVNDENFASFFFIDPVKDAEVYVSEAMINAVAHSVALIRVPEGADVEATAKSIQDNADPRKWICVEAESVQVVTKGRTILLAMSEKGTVDAIVKNFESIK